MYAQYYKFDELRNLTPFDSSPCEDCPDCIEFCPCYFFPLRCLGCPCWGLPLHPQPHSVYEADPRREVAGDE